MNFPWLKRFHWCPCNEKKPNVRIEFYCKSEYWHALYKYSCKVFSLTLPTISSPCTLMFHYKKQSKTKTISNSQIFQHQVYQKAKGKTDKTDVCIHAAQLCVAMKPPGNAWILCEYYITSIVTLWCLGWRKVFIEYLLSHRTEELFNVLSIAISVSALKEHNRAFTGIPQVESAEFSLSGR